MPFNFFKNNREADNSQNAGDAEKPDAENSLPIKVSAAGAEKASSVADEKKETESRRDRLKQESNSKVECRNPTCDEFVLNHYDGEFDEEGEALISNMYCLNCGFNFLYFDKFEKEEKTAEDGLNWSAGFALLVAMLFTVIAIKGEQEGRFFNNDSPAIIESTNQSETLRPSSDAFSTDSSPRVLNAAEPFKIRSNN